MDKFVIRTPRYQIDKDPKEVLKKVFNLDNFRGLQLDIIKAALENKDVVVLMVFLSSLTHYRKRTVFFLSFCNHFIYSKLVEVNRCATNSRL